MTDTIDIQKPLYELCALLDLPPHLVGELTIHPKSVTATVYKLDANGSKYVDFTPGEGPGTPATETRTFQVST